MKSTRGLPSRLDAHRRYAALGLVLCLAACHRAPAVAPQPPTGAPPDLHDAWQAVLTRYVENGAVDYAALNAARGELTSYQRRLEALNRATYEQMTRDDQIALWINAHNAYAIAMVLKYWPVTSIRQATPMVKRGPGGAFGIEYIPLGNLVGASSKMLSLDDIDDVILRQRFGEPRVQFALARACKSCPTLAQDAYRGEVLQQQLDQAARRFMADTAKNSFDPQRRELMVSPIFQWHAADFTALGGEFGTFRRYGPEASVAELEALGSTPTIRYSAYDWSLNVK